LIVLPDAEDYANTVTTDDVAEVRVVSGKSWVVLVWEEYLCPQ